MDTQHFIAASLGLMVAGTLVAAAITKGRQQRETVRSFTDLGLPVPTVLAVVVPAVELAIAVLIIVRFSVGSVVAVALLGMFTAFLGIRLRRGDVISCGCFGSAASTPVTSVTIIRNLMLISAAGLAAVGSAQLTRSDIAANEWVALVGAAGSFGLVGALIIALLTVRTSIGSVFALSPQPTNAGRVAQ
jgi:hypothetical protein